MAGAVNHAIGVKDITELFNHQRKSYRTVSRLLHTGEKMTTKYIAEQIEMSEGTVLDCVNHFREVGLIHIAGWEFSQLTSTILVPVYQLGNAPDVPKPKPKRADSAYRSKLHREKMKEREAQEDTYRWQGLVQALIPKRTEEEMRKVNWAYWCYINPDAVKYGL